MTKDNTAQMLTDAHFHLDHGVQRIFRIVAADESDEAKPVKLLEVNDLTPETGIMPIGMPAAPERGVDYPVIVVEVSPNEFVRMENGELVLPHNWKIGPELFPTAVPLEAAP